jgi:hypothetical protein
MKYRKIALTTTVLTGLTGVWALPSYADGEGAQCLDRHFVFESPRG